MLDLSALLALMFSALADEILLVYLLNNLQLKTIKIQIFLLSITLIQ
jgi:hypothetical protein